MTDKAAREATVTPTAHILVALPLPVTSTVTDYTAADKKDQAPCKGIYRKDGWLCNREFARQLIHQVHQASHLGC